MNLQPIPHPFDYQTAVNILDSELQSQGGPWVDAYREEKRTRDSRNLFNLYLQSGLWASDLEPLDVNDKPIDLLRRTTHSFKHGMIMGYKVVDLVHDGIIDSDGVLGGIGKIMEQDTSERHERAETLVSLGENGLRIMGDVARERIDAWSDEVVSDARARRMYALGCGAVVVTAHTIHVSYNERLLDEYFKTHSMIPDSLEQEI